MAKALAPDPKTGLTRKLTFNELIGVVEDGKAFPIKYPDRKALELRNSYELSILDGEGWKAMEEYEMRRKKEIVKNHILTDMAKNSKFSVAELKSTASQASQDKEDKSTMFVQGAVPTEDFNYTVRNIEHMAELGMEQRIQADRQRKRENVARLEDQMNIVQQQKDEHINELRGFLEQQQRQAMLATHELQGGNCACSITDSTH